MRAVISECTKRRRLMSVPAFLFQQCFCGFCRASLQRDCERTALLLGDVLKSSVQKKKRRNRHQVTRYGLCSCGYVQLFARVRKRSRDLEGTLSCSLHWSYVQVSCNLVKEKSNPEFLIQDGCYTIQIKSILRHLLLSSLFIGVAMTWC